MSHEGGLYQVDPMTGDSTYIGNTTSLNSLVYDTTTYTWYACGLDSQGIDSLFEIDISTGEETFVGHFGTSNLMISLMCDTDGNMYSYDVLFSGNSHLYSIDKDTGEAAVIGDMGHNFCYAQEGKFDRVTGILYLAAFDAGQSQSYLATCDPATGEITILQFFNPIMEVDAVTFIYGNPTYLPHAEFTFTPPHPWPGWTVFFDASGSYDYDGYIALYEWDWNNDGVFEESSTAPTATHSWDDQGNFTVVLRVTDNENLTDEKARTIVVDMTPPVTSISLSGSPGNEGWYVSPVIVSLSAVDDVSRVNYTMFCLDHDAWTVYTTPFTVPTEGTHQVKYYSTDFAGNVESMKSAEVMMDWSPPWTTVVIDGEPGLNGWFIKFYDFGFQAHDNFSGVNHTYFKLGDDAWIEYTGPVTLPHEGTFTIYYYSVDVAGNVEPVKGPFYLKIDSTPPVVNLTATPLNPSKTRWRFTMNISEFGSGLARVEVLVDGLLLINLSSPPWMFEYDGGGKTVQVIAYDNAGNAGASNIVQSLTMFTDRQAATTNTMLSLQQRTLQQAQAH